MEKLTKEALQKIIGIMETLHDKASTRSYERGGIIELATNDILDLFPKESLSEEELEEIIPQYNPHDYLTYVESIITDHERSDMEKVKIINELVKERVKEYNDAISHCHSAIDRVIRKGE